MVTVFNDAKRVTLTGWSWPSRQVAHEMAHSFAITGDSTLYDSLQLNLDYLTPHNHAFFLDAIVQSDLEKVKLSLRQSLAVSLRVDGSVDKQGLHNIYVMAYIVTPELTTSTLFIGFGVPKSSGTDGYLECLKRVVTKIMPWSEFFNLVTSIVTDGEPLNTGRLNGLIAKLKEERLRVNPNKPLYSIWCVPHRINLAWKSVSTINIIKMAIKHCINVSTYFRQSAVRTTNLKNSAETNNLNIPLRYPAFFEVRWTEYVYNLFNAVLRNWRSTIAYYKSCNLKSFLSIWLHKERLHFITFLTDVLSVVKKFQKSCQSDDICIADVLPLRAKCIASLENLKSGSLVDGWEELFLKSLRISGTEIIFYGHKLLKASGKQSFSFNSYNRQRVIQSLIKQINIRINFDSTLHETIQPLVNISFGVQEQDLKICHDFLVSDLNQNTFLCEYHEAAELLKDTDCDTPLTSLRTLNEMSPDGLSTIKIALARIVATKPHSADVERLISK